MTVSEEKSVKSARSLQRSTTCENGIQINQTLCGACTICSSICPLEAISPIEKTSEIKLDLEKCQVCGVCVSACPASAIETVYYDSDSLIKHVKESMSKTGASDLILTCRSNSLLPNNVREKLKKENVAEFISLRLPCVGRVSPEFVLKALASGIRNVIIVPCEEDHCRFNEGSKISFRRLKLLQALLEQLNLGTALTVIEGLPKAEIEKEKCISCGDCAEICPYEAIQLASSPRVAELNLDKCSGCGACAVVCPTLAIKIEGFEHRVMLHSISESRLLVNKIKNKQTGPVVLTFCCQWSEFSALDTVRSGLKDNVLFMELPCAARIESLHILEAFRSGFDGVLLAACRKNECKLEKGNDKAERRISMLKQLLSAVGLQDRFEICFVSPKYLGEFSGYLQSFRQALTKRGSLDLGSSKKMMLEGVIDALNSERSRLILERSQILLDKGKNVYDERVSQEDLERMFKAIEKEFMKRRIVVSMGEDALSVREIAQRVGVSPDQVLRSMISLESEGLVSVDRIEGNSPKYRLAIEQKPD